MIVSATPPRRCQEAHRRQHRCDPPSGSIQLVDRELAAVERWAPQAGMKALRLSVAEDNEPATALYLRNGLRLTRELGDLMPDGIRQERIMEKQLT